MTFDDRYSECLIPAKETGLRKGVVSGLGLGCLFFFMFSTYGLAFWYGSTLIFDGTLDVGDMLTCFFGVLIGAFSLGQVCKTNLCRYHSLSEAFVLTSVL